MLAKECLIILLSVLTTVIFLKTENTTKSQFKNGVVAASLISALIYISNI